MNSKDKFFVWKCIAVVSLIIFAAVPFDVLTKTQKTCISIVGLVTLAYLNERVFQWYRRLHGHDLDFDNGTWNKGRGLAWMAIMGAVVNFYVFFIK